MSHLLTTWLVMKALDTDLFESNLPLRTQSSMKLNAMNYPESSHTEMTK